MNSRDAPLNAFKLTVRMYNQNYVKCDFTSQKRNAAGTFFDIDRLCS